MHSGTTNVRGTSGGGRRGEPPNLGEYSNTPKYDLATIVQLVGVRPMILWGWEQQLGIPSPVRINDDGGSPIRRYSERDLIASLWLRDQIVNGVSPNDAAAKLLGVRHNGPASDESGGNPENSDAYGDPLAGGRVNTGPLPQSTFGPRRARLTMPLSDLERVPGGVPSMPLGLGQAQASGPLQRTTYPPAGATSGPILGQPGGTANPTWRNPVSGPLRPTSGPLPGGSYSGSVYSGTSGSTPPAGSPGMSGTYAAPNSVTYQAPAPVRPEAMAAEASASAMPWVGPGASSRGRELRALLPQLTRAFANFDTFAANHIVAEALGARSVETVCVSLLQPALARAADMWGRREMTSPEERFGVNYVRGVLFAIFHKTPERFEGPMVIVGCGPREINDIGALTLAVFWRRAGLRVIFLGQDVDADGLVEEVRKRRPAMIALSVSSSQRVRSLGRLARHIMSVETPRPIFAFSGPVFARNPELQRKVSGVYLGDDAATATWHARNLLGIDLSDR